MTDPDNAFMIHAGIVITDPSEIPGYLTDAALLIEGERITGIGPWPTLRQRHPDLPVIGGPEMIALPGLINAHDHGRGISPLSLGIADDLLEPWILSLMRMPALNPCIDTRLSALRQLRSGISTTINSYYHPGNSAETLRAVRQGYAEAGLRAGIIASAMDRPATVSLLQAALPHLSPDLRASVEARNQARTPFDMSMWARTLEEATAECLGLTTMMAGVISGHWSSDAQITQVEALAQTLGLATQMHLLESRHQARDNARFGNGGITARLEALSALHPGASLAHCVQATRQDCARFARNDTSVVHNPSSNLRLRSGVAPVPMMLSEGVNVALGLDSAGLNDTADMFLEMRLAMRLHGVLPARRILTMATVGGGQAIGRPDLGRLAQGGPADILLLDGTSMAAPGLRAPEQVFDRVVLYGSPAAVDTLFVGGSPILRNGRHRHLSEETLLAELTTGLPRAPDDTDTFVAAVLPALHQVLEKEDLPVSRQD